MKKGTISQCSRWMNACIKRNNLESFFIFFLLMVIILIPVLIMSLFDTCWRSLLIVLVCICVLDGAIAYQCCFIQLRRVVVIGACEFLVCLAILIPALEDTRNAFYQRYLVIRNAIDAFDAWYTVFLELHPELLGYSKFLAPLGVMIQIWSAASIKPAKSEWNPIMSFKLHIGTTSTFMIILLACFFASYVLHLHTFYYPLISFISAVSTICLCLYSCFQMIIIPDKRLELKISNYLFSLIKLPLTYVALLKCNITRCEAFIHELKAVLGYRASSSRSRKGSLVETMIKELNSIKTDGEQEGMPQEEKLRALHFALGLCWAHLHDLGESEYEKYLMRMSRVWAKHYTIKENTKSYNYKHYHALQFGLVCGELLVGINIDRLEDSIQHIKEMIEQYHLKNAYLPITVFNEISGRCPSEYSNDISFLNSLKDKKSNDHKEVYKNIIDHFEAE